MALISFGDSTPSNPYASAREAEKALRKFLEQPCDIKRGDLVVRKEYGLNHYKMPTANQAAICIGFLKRMNTGNSPMETMVIAVTDQKDSFYYFRVNPRFYRRAEAAPSNLLNFYKKKVL